MWCPYKDFNEVMKNKNYVYIFFVFKSLRCIRPSKSDRMSLFCHIGIDEGGKEFIQT